MLHPLATVLPETSVLPLRTTGKFTMSNLINRAGRLCAEPLRGVRRGEEWLQWQRQARWSLLPG